MIERTLFDWGEVDAPAVWTTPEPKTRPDHPDLDNYALLWTATEKGNCSGQRFAMSVDDAMAFCESPVSRGVLHGTEWAYFWTRLRSWLDAWSAEQPLSEFLDDGSWDGRIAALGLTKIDWPEFKRRFGWLGFTFAAAPVKARAA